MPSKRNPSGYLEIDNNGAEPPSRTLGIPGETIGGGVQRLETQVFQCSHCQRDIVVNPEPFRKEEIPYCPKCDHYICKQCNIIRVASGGVCKPFKQVIDDILRKQRNLSYG